MLGPLLALVLPTVGPLLVVPTAGALGLLALGLLALPGLLVVPTAAGLLALLVVPMPEREVRREAACRMQGAHQHRTQREHRERRQVG